MIVGNITDQITGQIYSYKYQLSLTNPRDALHHGKRQNLTSSSAAAERPREPLSQLKSCQLLHNCTKNHI